MNPTSKDGVGRPPRGGLDHASWKMDAFCIAMLSDVCGRAAPSGHRGIRETMRTASRAEASPRSARPRASGGHGLSARLRPQRFRPGRRSRRRTPVAARAGPHAPCSFRTSPHVVLRTHHLTHPPPILLHHRSRYSYHPIPHDIGGDISSLMHAVPQRCGLVRTQRMRPSTLGPSCILPPSTGKGPPAHAPGCMDAWTYPAPGIGRRHMARPGMLRRSRLAADIPRDSSRFVKIQTC